MNIDRIEKALTEIGECLSGPNRDDLEQVAGRAVELRDRAWSEYRAKLAADVRDEIESQRGNEVDTSPSCR